MKLRKVITTAGFMFAGVSSANAQLYMCQSCPTGSWSDGTFTSCKNCLTTGVTACNSITGKATSCKSGYSLSNGTCSICPAGTYSTGGTASCTKCSAGYYSSTGATSCSECSSGTYSSAGASSCTKCSTGYFSEKAWDSCSNKWMSYFSTSRYNYSLTLSAGMYKFYVKGGQGDTEYENGYKYCGSSGDSEVVYRYFSSNTQIKTYVGTRSSSEIYLSNGELIVRASAGEDGGGSKIYVHETSSTATDSCPEYSGNITIYKLIR